MVTDARKLGHRTLTEMRKRAIVSIEAGEIPSQVARVFGVNVCTVFRWMALYRSGGVHRLAAKKRGGRPAKLDGKAMKWVYNTVTWKNPLQLKFPFALWTSAMIGELIKKRYGIELSRSSICRLLKQMGLSPQRPLWRAYKQDTEAVKRWLKEEYPKLKKTARRRKADIYFGDEAVVRSDFHGGTTWGKRGNTPVVSSTGARFGVNIISAVNAKGKFRFMLTKNRVSAKVFIEFLRRLLTNTENPVFLIVAGHPSHKAKCVRKFVDEQEGMLELYFLPSYSPELNPDEYVWNDLKNNCIGRKFHTSKEHLRKSVISHLRKIQKLPDLAASFFRIPKTRYAII